MTIITDQAKLKKPAAEVKDKDELLRMAYVLLTTLAALGPRAAGLAAQQVGFTKRVMTMNIKPLPAIFIANPVITKKKGTQVHNECCLSLPGVEMSVKRPLKVTIKGLNQYRRPVKHKLTGLQARIACHEVDHLDGVLITDIGRPIKKEN